MRFNLVLPLVFVLFCTGCMASDPLHNSCSVVDCINNGKSDISSAILCKNCIAKILSKSDTANLLREIQWKMNHRSRPKLGDLNVDVLFLIFDDLHIFEILNLIKAYPSRQLSAVAKDCFRRRYKDYVIYIDSRPPTTNKQMEINDASKHINLVDKAGAKILRYFEGQIRDLELLYPSAVIIDYIEKYAIDSLKRIKLISKKDTFTHLTKPFKEVEELIVINEIQGEHRPLNQLFPKLRRLTFKIYGHVNIRFLLCQFPSLEHFEIQYPFRAGGEEIFEEFFQKNPLVESLTVNYLSDNICSIINKHATHLKNLTVSTHDFAIVKHNFRQTTFEHVQHFRITRTQSSLVPESLNKLTFPRLESLSVVLLQITSSTFMEFAKNHKNVSRLTLEGAYENDYTKLYEIIEIFPQLEYLKLEHADIFNRRIVAGTISEILERCRKLRKLDLLASFFSESETNNLKGKFENDWHIAVEYYQRDARNLANLSFEKKN